MSIDIDKERVEDERDALADLRKAVTDGASDEWLLGFIRGYPFAATQPAPIPAQSGVCPACPKDTPYGPATCFNCVKDSEASAGNALTDELQVVHKFLLGEGPLEGVWFGDRHPERNGTSYWWRKNLSAAIASHIKAGQAGKERP